jgi:hypothetical protein
LDLQIRTIAPSASAARDGTPAHPVHPRLTALDPRPAQWISDRLRG